MREFKVGDKVVSLVHGIGEVVKDNSGTTKYSVIVKFVTMSSYNFSFTKDGYFYEHTPNKILYHLGDEPNLNDINRTQDSEFKRGEYVLVGDNIVYKKRIFITEIKGAEYPYVVVGDGDEENFMVGKRFHIALYKNAKSMQEEIVELTLQDISNGKGVGIPSHLIRIKE